MLRPVALACLSMLPLSPLAAAPNAAEMSCIYQGMSPEERDRAAMNFGLGIIASPEAQPRLFDNAIIELVSAAGLCGSRYKWSPKDLEQAKVHALVKLLVERNIAKRPGGRSRDELIALFNRLSPVDRQAIYNDSAESDGAYRRAKDVIHAAGVNAAAEATILHFFGDYAWRLSLEEKWRRGS